MKSTDVVLNDVSNLTQLPTFTSSRPTSSHFQALHIKTQRKTMGNCSSYLTKPCLGLSDPRYDPNVSFNLIDQDVLWQNYAGFWGPFAERRNTLSDNNAPRKPSFYDPVKKVGWPYESDLFTSYRYVSIEGTRLKKTTIYLYKPASEEFCSQT